MCYLNMMSTVFTLNIGTPQLISILLKLEKDVFHDSLMCLNIAGQEANRVDPDQTPHSVMSDLRVIIDPRLFKEKRRDTVFSFLWCVACGAWFRIFNRYLVPLTPPTVFVWSFWNLTGALKMVWRYACFFFRILKLFFITFYSFWI